MERIYAPKLFISITFACINSGCLPCLHRSCHSFMCVHCTTKLAKGKEFRCTPWQICLKTRQPFNRINTCRWSLYKCYVFKYAENCAILHIHEQMSQGQFSLHQLHVQKQFTNCKGTCTVTLPKHVLTFLTTIKFASKILTYQ